MNNAAKTRQKYIYTFFFTKADNNEQHSYNKTRRLQSADTTFTSLKTGQ